MFLPSLRTSGLLYQLLILMQATMISVCWTGANLIKLIKTFKFLELASVNMLAMTNLAICMNLALVVMVSYLWQTNGGFILALVLACV